MSNIEIKKLKKSEIEISGEVPAEDFNGFWNKAIKDLSKDASVPGFRPGKVPEKMIIEKVGEGGVLNRAAELAVQDVYPKIIKEKNIEAIAYPQVTITKMAKGEALGFKVVVAVIPHIELPENYQKTASEIIGKKEKVVVDEKELDASLEQLRKMKAGGEGGELPKLDDEFAKSVGKFESLNELKETIEKNLQEEKKHKAKEKKNLEALDSILKKSKVEIPEAMVEGEKKKMLAELRANIMGMGLKWEDYLGQIKKTEEDLLSAWGEDALRRVKYGLLLRQLGQEMKIETKDEEIEAEIDKFGIRDKENVDLNAAKDYAKGMVRNRKVFEELGKE